MQLATLTGLNSDDLRLTWGIFKLNIRDRYLGSRLGLVWSVANPILQLLLFTYVFGFVYKVKLPGSETTLAYAIWLISGYGPWLAMVESITAATVSITSNGGLIKNMAFKTEVLPIAAALTGFVPLLVCLTFLTGLLIIDGRVPTAHALFILLVIALQFLFVIALGIFFAALNVFIRDFAIALPNIFLMILFASPIFYPLDAMPRVLRVVSVINPFYILAEGYRKALVHNEIPDLPPLAFVALSSVAIAYASLRIFRRVKGHFSSMV